MIEVTNNALPNYTELEQRIRSGEFAGVLNPVDGVVYPDLCEVPDDIARDLDRAISKQYPYDELRTCFQFGRLSVEGVFAPHQVHNDSAMAEITSLLYLSDEGGTELCSHRRLGFNCQPQTPMEQLAWERDHNRPEAWVTDLYVPARRNKLVSYESTFMHRSTPIGGFGRDATDGRLVIVTFSERA